VGSLLAFVSSAREEGKEHLPHAHGNIARHFKEPKLRRPHLPQMS